MLGLGRGAPAPKPGMPQGPRGPNGQPLGKNRLKLFNLVCSFFKELSRYFILLITY